MKYFIFVFLFLFAISAHAQITLDHAYAQPGDIGLVEVDSGLWEYVSNSNDTIRIYNLDHSLERIIPIPVPSAQVIVVAKGLFELDGSYCYLASVQSGGFSNLRIFKEDGTLLFSRDSAYLGTSKSNNENVAALDGFFPPAIRSTPDGTKMMVTLPKNVVEVYTLPGKPPGRQSKMAGVTPSEAEKDASIPTSAYPNPSTGRVRIAYQLPAGVSFGEVILMRENGTEVNRYRVTNDFNDLLIDASGLPSGAYYYKLVTEKGDSPVEAIAITK